MKKVIIQVLLLAVIIVLAYLIYESIMQPVRFNRERDKRMAEVIQNLKDIRSAEVAFKTIHNRYTASFDTLLDFVDKGEIPVIKMVPDPTDTTFTRSILDTIAFIRVYDSLFAKRPEFRLQDLPVIPFSEGDTFKLEAGQIERSKIMIHVFESSSLNAQFLKGMDTQLINNYSDFLENTERFPGLKVGSMEEATIDGNWE